MWVQMLDGGVLDSGLDGCPGTCQARITLILPEQMFQMAHLLKMENSCANLYRNPSKMEGVMVSTKI